MLGSRRFLIDGAATQVCYEVIAGALVEYRYSYWPRQLATYCVENESDADFTMLRNTLRNFQS